MKEPTGCVLWTDPEPVLAVPLKENFELLETFVKEDHWWRYLLKCRECGQRYFYEFLEEVDWAGGEDPQYCTWIPIDTEDDLARVKAAGQLDLRGFTPSLRTDWPKDAPEKKVYWVKGEGT